MYEALSRLVLVVSVLLLRCRPNVAWTYSKSVSWGDQCKDGNQSPINIVSNEFQHPATTLSKLKLNGASCPMGWFVMKNYTWEVQFRDRDTCALQGWVTWEETQYYLNSFRFHSPSEHKVNGLNYDMEVQFLHENAMGLPLVISVLAKVGEESDWLAHFIKAFPASPSEIVAKVGMSLNPYGNFFPNQDDYWTYKGSFTTPPCKTDVRWVVLSTPVEVSAAQLNLFRAAITAVPGDQLATFDGPPDGVTLPWNTGQGLNNRPVQDLEDREVLKYVVEGDTGMNHPTGFQYAGSKALVVPLVRQSFLSDHFVAVSCVFASAGFLLFLAKRSRSHESELARRTIQVIPSEEPGYIAPRQSTPAFNDESTRSLLPDGI